MSKLLNLTVFLFLFLGLLIGAGWIGNILRLDIFSVTIGIGLISILFTLLFRKLVDRKTIASMGWKWKGHEKDFSAGSLLSIAILGSGTIILAFAGFIEWMQVKWEPASLFTAFILMLVVSFYEELAFRGYILNNLMDTLHPAKALVVSALIFAIFHGTNPNASLLGIFNVFIAGMLLGINYLFTRNLWFGIGFHFCWNFIQGPVLGFGVSGLNLSSILTQEQSGSAIWTGGSFGFEGSLLNTLLCLTAGVLLFLIYTIRHKKMAAGMATI